MSYSLDTFEGFLAWAGWEKLPRKRRGQQLYARITPHRLAKKSPTLEIKTYAHVLSRWAVIRNSKLTKRCIEQLGQLTHTYVKDRLREAGFSRRVLEPVQMEEPLCKENG
jgi:predicted GNAT family acetyltransferase